MQYIALAADYDGTIATHGVVEPETVAALQALKATGRKLLLVTGRELDDLARAFPHLELFDRVVAENGAVVHTPADGRTETLGERPPDAFVEALRQRGITPLSVGHVIVATWEPHETVVVETIRELGLELQVIFNKGAVMVLPAGVNKATGLRRALDDLGVSAHNVVGVGDAENDHAFLTLCECAVAVENALPTLKAHADLVTTAAKGAGVAELIGRLIEDDLRAVVPDARRHRLPLGTTRDRSEVTLGAHNTVLLIAGASGAGKSTTASALLETHVLRRYQFCLIDPEGDYGSFKDAVVLGDERSAPSIDEIVTALDMPATSVVAVLLGIGIAERPAFLQRLSTRLGELKATTGRPHWLVLDEAHHLLARDDGPPRGLPEWVDNALLITVHPDQLDPHALAAVTAVIGIGREAAGVIGSAAAAIGADAPTALDEALEEGEILFWDRAGSGAAVPVRPDLPRGERLRHRRKYAEGTLEPDRSFYFRGPDGALNLRAQNLTIFLQMAEGVDVGTWLYHLQTGDYSRWVGSAIKDEALAGEIANIEATPAPSAADTRAAVAAAIGRRYTKPS